MPLDMDEAKRIFQKLYSDIDGRSLSLKERDQKKISDKSFVYGEVVPDSFCDVINEIDPQPGSTFYDLGSGTGKAVLLAHMLFDFPKCIGIEILDGLFNASIQMQERYEKEFRPRIQHKIGNKTMQFIHESFLTSNLSDADIVFINSTCFQEDLISAIEEKLEELRPHVPVITLSKSLKTPSFHQYKHKLFEFSWGQATAFYHRKRLWKVYF